MDRQETRIVKEKGALVGLDRRVLAYLMGMVTVLFVITAGLWLFGQRTLAVGIGAFTLFAFQLLWTVAIFALGAWWSFVQYRAGADIAVRSQESDDQRDIAMMNALGRIIDVVIKSAPKISPPQESPPPTFDRPQDFAPALRRLRPPLLDQDDMQ